jgi:hypothetical protein
LLLFKKKDPAPEKDAYLAGDLCCFCQSDSACGTGPVDADSDGYFPPDDWNDNDAAVNPGATEVFTGATDDDCDNKLTKQLNHFAKMPIKQIGSSHAAYRPYYRIIYWTDSMYPSTCVAVRYILYPLISYCGNALYPSL